MFVNSTPDASRLFNDNNFAKSETATPAAPKIRKRDMQARIAALEADALRYKAALDTLSQGVCIFDDQDRLVLCNKSYAQTYRLSPAQLRPGVSLQEILELQAAPRMAAKASLDPALPFSRSINAGEGSSVWTSKLTDGRTVQISHEPMPGGGWMSSHEDITERAAMRAVEGERISLQALIDAVPGYLWVKDTEGRFVVVNQALASDCGQAKTSDMIGLTDFDIHSPGAAREFHALEQNIVHTGAPMTNREEFVTDSLGVKRWLLSTKIPLQNEANEIFGIVGIAHDITERVRVKEELRRTQEFLNLVIENIPEAIIVKDVNTRKYTMINRAAEDIFGLPRTEVIGATAEAVYSGDYLQLVNNEDDELLRSGELFITDHAFTMRGRETRTVTVTRKILKDDKGTAQFMLAVIQDVTDRKNAEARIAHLALHDPLTNLPNRAMFNERLGQALQAALDSGRRFALVCVDLDRLKEVNDVFGHAAGDQLLRELSARLLTAAGDAFLARLGGDEFALIAPDADHPAMLADLTNRLLAAIVHDVDIHGVNIHAGLSLGVAVFPDDGSDAKSLLANADAALYRAKAEGRGIARFFKADMDENRREHHVIRHDLGVAIERGEITMYYQPQAKVTGEIVGFEALMRWRHPLRGLVPPNVFIPIAEESRLITRIGEWALRDVCRQATTWPRHLSVAVNLSPVQFQHGDLPSLVHTILLETGLAPHRLELEITEGVLMADSARALALLRRLKALGVRIAMDDFGKGYSSLSYLQSFPFDKIKIDRAFVSKIEQRPQSAAIFRAVLGLARGLGLPLLAEGAETPEELAFLAAEACDQVQGYLIGRPLPIEDYAEITRDVLPLDSSPLPQGHDFHAQRRPSGLRREFGLARAAK